MMNKIKQFFSNIRVYFFLMIFRGVKNSPTNSIDTRIYNIVLDIIEGKLIPSEVEVKVKPIIKVVEELKEAQQTNGGDQ